MAKVYDVLVLGAGPAGIAAARHLRKENVSFRVLEARSRVGGRAHTSDSLGVNRPLDHGARWIHGACADNSMVKLVRDMVFDHPEDNGVDYEVCLPWEEKKTKVTTILNESSSATLLVDKTPPPFELSDSETEAESEPMIVKIRNDKRNKIPTKNLTKILTKAPPGGSVSAKDMSMDARRVARKVFKETIKSAMEDPHQKLNCDSDISVKEEALESASLMEVLLWLHQHKHEHRQTQQLENEEYRHTLFASLCEDTLVAGNENVQKAVALLDTEEEREAFRNEVFALFNLEMYTFFESWEGAPIHSISAKYGMASTCLPGGNVVLPFGYGGLVKRLAYPLTQNNSILLEQNVVSIETMENTGQGPKVVVRYQARDDDSGEIHEVQASACIVALPLGVLRAATMRDDASRNTSITFEPELPPPLIKSIQSLGVAVRNKIELLFPTRWWPETVGRITLACAHLQQTPTYHPYTTFIVESASGPDTDSDNPNILVCYVAGEFAKETEQKTNEQIQVECMAVLRQADLALDQVIPDPIALHVTRWLRDPFSRGSWTFYGKGSSPEDVRAFRSNTDCQKRGLFFAGEHTCDGSIPGDDMGCVHGAWVSGELAAKAALQQIGQ